MRGCCGSPLGSWLPACVLLLGPEGTGGVAVVLCGWSGRVPSVRAAVRERGGSVSSQNGPTFLSICFFEGPATLL